jgi:hypothetical protein
MGWEGPSLRKTEPTCCTSSMQTITAQSARAPEASYQTGSSVPLVPHPAPLSLFGVRRLPSCRTASGGSRSGHLQADRGCQTGRRTDSYPAAPRHRSPAAVETAVGEMKERRKWRRYDWLGSARSCSSGELEPESEPLRPARCLSPAL